jgi:uncharacterized membrane-anchored protein YitT (DUF2179 family)/predicted metal-dependent HD superfamily phosphohydrolase
MISQKTMNNMHFDQAHSFLIEKLEQELSPDLTYHNAYHTRSVVQATQQLCEHEKLDEHHTKILITAALFHDAGFLRSYHDHEEMSCEVAKEFLPQYGYGEKEIHQICRLIMATKLPQRPTNVFESIICDADLHYLGTDNYFLIAENLFQEYKKLDIVKNRADWKKKQIQFFNSHRYFTRSAKEKYEKKKQENFRLLKREDESLETIGYLSTAKDIFFMVTGAIIAGFALKGFLVPNNFFDGGVTGISLLIHEIYHVNLSYVIFACNLPLIIISYFTVSRRFAVMTSLCIVLLSLCLLFMPYPKITTDKLLISIFGGIFLGIGMGFAMRIGCALDGIEVLALYTRKRTSLTITEIIMGINIIIFSIAGVKFGMETALYSVLTYLAATRTIDYVVEGIEAYTGVTIISGNSELIKQKLVNELGRSITIYKGERGYLPGKFEVSIDCDIIFTVITRLELRKLKNLVYEADPKAFVFANTIKEASGGILKRRHTH